MLFAIIAFVLLARRRPVLQLNMWRRSAIYWFTGAVVMFAAAWLSVNHLLLGQHSLPWMLGAHFSLLAAIALAAVGSFGLSNIKKIASYYHHELLVAFAAAIGFYLLLTFIYSTWGLLATAVLHAVRLLLDLSGLTVAIVEPRTLLLDKFGITIAQYCSGIESLALFSGLYAIVGFLDWPKLHRRKFLITFPLALVGLFICNILRVYVLILGGYYINPQLAFSLFHTYAGMLFFILYAAIFWKVSYAWMLRKS